MVCEGDGSAGSGGSGISGVGSIVLVNMSCDAFSLADARINAEVQMGDAKETYDLVMTDLSQWQILSAPRCWC